MLKARRNWRALMLVVLVISSVVIAGCTAGELPGGLTDGSAPSQYQQVLNNSLLALKNSVDFKFVLNIAIAMDVKGGSAAGILNVGSTMNGTIKQNTNEMQMDMNMSLNSDQQGIAPSTQNVSLHMYVIADTLYMGMDGPASGGQWFKTAYSEDIASLYNLDEVTQQLAPLAANVTNLKYVKSENFDGSECYVLTMTPNMAEIIPWLSQDLPANVKADQIAKIFKQLSYTVWIAKDSSQLKNLEGTMQLQINANQFSGSDSVDLSSVTMNLTLTMKLYDYNVPASITLPPGANSALELPVLPKG